MYSDFGLDQMFSTVFSVTIEYRQTLSQVSRRTHYEIIMCLSSHWPKIRDYYMTIFISTRDTHISQKDEGTCANIGVSGWYRVWYENWHIITYLSYTLNSIKRHKTNNNVILRKLSHVTCKYLAEILIHNSKSDIYINY